MSPSTVPSKTTVGVVYHFFAHYRLPVIQKLLESDNLEVLFVADTHDPGGGGIPVVEGIPARSFRRSRFLSIAYPLGWQTGLVRLALADHPQVLVFLGVPYWPATWISAGLARLRGKRVLFWTHGWRGSEKAWQIRLRRVFFRLADGLLLYGHWAKNSGIRQGLPPEKLHVIYNSLHSDHQLEYSRTTTEADRRATRAHLFPEPELPLVLAIGRLQRSKRFDLLIDAVARLRAQEHFVNLLIIGDGQMRRELEERAAAANVPAHFYGACYEEDELAPLISAASLTASPGNVGLTALHSLAYGVPVVTHDRAVDQMPEWEAVIPGLSGQFFRQGDADSLASVIASLTTTGFPSAETRRQCRTIVERFYNPTVQRSAIERAVAGLPANDLWWSTASSIPPVERSSADLPLSNPPDGTSAESRGTLDR